MKFTEEQKADLDKVYDYIRYQLLKYEEGTVLPRMVVHRIRGTMFGKLYQRGSDELPIIYPLPVILATLMFAKNDILYCLSTMKFKNESHRINTIFKIVDDNINTVKIAMERKQAEDKKSATADVTHFNTDIQPYKAKSNIKDKFKEFL